MSLKVFIQERCPKCEIAKPIMIKIRGMGHAVEFFDIGDREGLAESAFYSVQSTPTVILVDDSEDELDRWSGDISKAEILARMS